MLRHLAAVAMLLVAPLGVASAEPKPDAPAIIQAAFKGDAAKVKNLLASGVSPDVRDASNFTALNWAAYAGFPDVVQVLIEAKADINSHSNDANWTPLMNAIGSGDLTNSPAKHAEIALYLIEHGAEVSLIDSAGHSALGMAADKKLDQVTERLIARGADQAVALIQYVRDDNQAAIGVLIDSGANVNAIAPEGLAKFSPGDTALLVAAEANKAPMVSFLLSRGADPNLASPLPVNMTTALMWAAYHCNADMARALVARGASLSATNQGGSTARDLARTGWTSDMKACGSDVERLLSGG